MMSLNFIQAPIGVSARHVHLSTGHAQQLFNSELMVLRELSQHGEFAAQECLSIVTQGRALHGVRVLGPCREKTQVELAISDAIQLGINVPVRLSGRLDGTPGVTLVGTAGSVTLKEGVIIAARHLHVPVREATQFHLSQNQALEAWMGNDRQCCYRNVIVRISPAATLELHLDTDEANAAGVSSGDITRILIPEAATQQKKSRFVCVEDIQELIKSGAPLQLTTDQRLTAAARELARSKGIIKN
jgi:putative phosphotransacetylase